MLAELDNLISKYQDRYGEGKPYQILVTIRGMYEGGKIPNRIQRGKIIRAVWRDEIKQVKPALQDVRVRLLSNTFSAAAGMFLALESASFALQAASIAACFGAAFVAAFWRGAGTHVAGGIGPAVVALCGLLIYGCFYWNVPTTSALLIAFAPAAAFAGELGAIRKRPAWQGVLIRAGAAAIPTGIAVWIAIANAPEPYY